MLVLQFFVVSFPCTQVKEKFCLHLSEEEAIQFFQSLIDESVKALFAVFMEQIHRWAQVLWYLTTYALPWAQVSYVYMYMHAYTPLLIFPSSTCFSGYLLQVQTVMCTLSHTHVYHTHAHTHTPCSTGESKWNHQHNFHMQCTHVA